MSDILDRILTTKREEVAALRPRAAEWRMAAAGAQSAPRGFARRLRADAGINGIAVVAEIKKASPSKGPIREDFDPAWLAAAYARGGASCLSVLTDRQYFQGAADYLETARAACDLPVLRKDFVIDELQVYEARAMGADCVLLIAAALDDAAMRELAGLSLSLGMDVLAEVHDGAELDRALALDDRCMIGINNRDLKTFHTSLETTLELRERVPDDRLLVSESGIHTREDVARLRDAGVPALLIGESLMRQESPDEALVDLLRQER